MSVLEDTERTFDEKDLVELGIEETPWSLVLSDLMCESNGDWVQGK